MTIGRRSKKRKLRSLLRATGEDFQHRRHRKRAKAVVESNKERKQKLQKIINKEDKKMIQKNLK